MKLELIRMGIVYVHLLACCIAIGTVFMSDLQLVRELVAGGRGTLDPSELRGLHRTLVWTLSVLWVTGLALVGFDAVTKGMQTLLNPKLQAKIAVVVLLTLNGVVLERHVLPALQKAGSLLRLQFGPRMLSVFVGAVSAASWLYAAMLGVGRPLNWKFSLVEIMAGWPMLVVGGFLTMTLVTTWAQRQRMQLQPVGAMR
ncbi:hypothetical protein ACPWT1_00310 [Ramlibacter sp. MMS24-I3-19]|uniref:hypothetical protein n=1 Tax=Ramlibacter sp. MMS24-I3-19 TaxID=3416606 RepID=UPI003D016FBB